MMSGQCLSSSSLPGSLDSCPHRPRERMRTRISTLTVRGAPHAQPPRPPRVVLAPRALEPEEGPASDPRKLPRGSPARQPLLHPCSRPGGQERDPTPGPRGSCSCHPAAGPRDAGVRGHVGAGSGWQVGGEGQGHGLGHLLLGFSASRWLRMGEASPAWGHWTHDRLPAFRVDSGWQFPQGRRHR